MSDLSLATTEELFEELVSRHTAIVLITEEKPKLVGDESTIYRVRRDASWAQASGLIHYAEMRMADLYFENTFDEEEDTE